ncbi:MAG: hypothetical protein IPO07_31170 [Haliscomenobacter sp.]|nr:hypothetical protein [Haliscomenobacter sp.]MBK9492740.1 hypothetical protein [Haliscomenobacter sp.]
MAPPGRRPGATRTFQRDNLGRCGNLPLRHPRLDAQTLLVNVQPGKNKLLDYRDMIRTALTWRAAWPATNSAAEKQRRGKRIVREQWRVLGADLPGGVMNWYPPLCGRGPNSYETETHHLSLMTAGADRGGWDKISGGA